MDSSNYNEDVAVTCARLEITPPGFDYPVAFEVEPYFNIAFNSSSLGLARVSKYIDLAELPDGVYKLRYSIAPNDKVWVEYEILRNQQQFRRYFELYCRLKLNNLDPNRDQNKSLKQLLDLKQELDAAKIEVEVCGNPDKGMEIYRYVAKQLDKLGAGHCTSCKTK